MSSIKYRLRELLPSLSFEANQLKDVEARKRFYLIRAVCSSVKDIKKVCEFRGVSTDFFYKWAKRLLEKKDLSALLSKSRAPRRIWNKTPKRVEKRIVSLRNQTPFKGPERLSRKLKMKFNMKCPAGTVARILKRKGLVTKAYRERLTKKHMKRYRRPFPGYLQLDIKYVPYLIEGKQFYQFSVIDHHSAWRLIRAYADRSLYSVISFLDELERQVPFAVMQIQTDNATEFTDKYSSNGGGKATGYHLFDQWCEKRGIEHRLIPIGQKEINGKVENSHKFDDREFYSQNSFATLWELKAKIQEHNDNWNDSRETKTLGWKTPSQVVKESFPRALAFLNLMRERYGQPELKPIKTITNGGYVLKVPAVQKPKKPSLTDRYLQYLDWETKKGFRATLLMPPMFRDFSRFENAVF